MELFTADDCKILRFNCESMAIQTSDILDRYCKCWLDNLSTVKILFCIFSVKLTKKWKSSNASISNSRKFPNCKVVYYTYVHVNVCRGIFTSCSCLCTHRFSKYIYFSNYQHTFKYNDISCVYMYMYIQLACTLRYMYMYVYVCRIGSSLLFYAY